MTDREQKILDNMNLVHYIIHKNFPQYMMNQDVIQNGYVGLIKAAALKTEEETGLHAKDIWWQMIQLLPSSYNQKRTELLNYQVLAHMYQQRKNHKQDEWRVTFCDWIKTLPYSEFITGEFKEEPQ